MPSKRRLAAVMFTDVVGFTAATQANEPAALRDLEEHGALLRPLFARFGGREVKSTGDGFLVEFASALQATECAVEIQRRLGERNRGSAQRPILVRVGIHLGDIERRGTDILGDTVNVASRVVQLAEPGGVVVSEPVFVQVRDKVPQRFERLGPRSLKNVRLPLEVFRLTVAPSGQARPGAGDGPVRLAVLPFTNISPDPKDEYFADGLTEELITNLSQVRELRVIARTSVFGYKGQGKSVAQIGSELGVDSVLEGSVRKSGDQLRIAAQLVDVASQEHRWAMTYDRQLDNVFAVQADIAKRIADVLKVRLHEAEEARLAGPRTFRTDSYLAYLKGRSLLHTSSTEKLTEAKVQFERAIELDPTNAAAYSGLADATRILGWRQVGPSRAEWDRLGRELTERAIELDPHLADAHASRGLVLWDDFDFVACEAEFRIALAANPSNALAHYWYSLVLEDLGRVQDALREATLAIEADPHSLVILDGYIALLIWLEKFAEAEEQIEKLTKLDPDGSWSHSLRALYLLSRAKFVEALREMGPVERVEPDATYVRLLYAEIYGASGDRARAVEKVRAMEKAGDPDWSLANAWGLIGDLDATFRYLDRARESHFLPLQAFQISPLFAPLRRDPRYAAFLRKMNIG